VRSEQEIEILKDLGRKIERHMKNQGVNNTQLAFELGTSESAVRRILKGEVSVGYLNLHYIAIALNLSVSQLTA
jgi:transcriptional regulator with XRE-family HTH domain